MPSDIPQRGLLGRRNESATLNGLLEAVRAGESRALVIRGDPGIGKTALLEYVVERATGCRVAQAAGVQAEMELAFAGLHQLCAPMLDRLERLPGPQRDALGSAFGLAAGDAPNRFLVGLAVLSLLAEVSEERPLVCLVDDAQWLDHASAQALVFVARRLLAESVAMVFAVRTGGEEQELTGLPELVIEGLNDRDARALLALQGPVGERVRDRIVAEARGNPLALLELPRAMTPAELAGGFRRLDAPGLAGRIEESFRRRLDPLPAETRQLLLIAAAEPVGDPAMLWRAAERLGIAADAATPATAADLFELGARVRFRHPLVRSAVYRVASHEERRTVHRALAEATDPDVDPDRRAWHRANAAPGPDEDVASEIERAAERAQARGGLAAAAAFLERSAALSVDPARRAARALAAAQATHQAGLPDAALGMLATAQAGPLDELQRARVDRLRAQIACVMNHGRDAPPVLLAAAKRLEPLDLPLARETYLDALWAAIIVGRLADGGGVLEAAMAARAVPPAPEPPRPADLLLDGLAVLLTEGHAAAAPTLERVLSAFRGDDISQEEGLRWFWLACHVARLLWDDESWEVLCTRHLRLSRDTGSLTVLHLALNQRMGMHEHSGELAAAAALSEEVEDVGEAIGAQLGPYGALALAAWRGREADLSELIDAMMDDVVARGEGTGLAIIPWASTLLHNGLGRYEEGLAAAQKAGAFHDELLFSTWGLVELIEAAVRSGQPEPAADALRRLSEATRASGNDWGLGIEARSRALLSDDEAAESLYREAIERLGRTRIRAELARAHLLYGEWLRRQKRRLDAREQLRTAHEMLTAMGMEAFAQRASDELEATGETARKRSVEAPAQLTAREAQIARLARDGLSNPDIGARLFISPRTVEYHLHKVFGKLDITSRNELAGTLAGEAGSALSV
jgi:DNA-binding CsgD family transcriptional regulator/tetratricopeptide (TPR) repeat protein